MLKIAYKCNTQDNTVAGFIGRSDYDNYEGLKQEWCDRDPNNCAIENEFDVEKFEDIPLDMRTNEQFLRKKVDLVEFCDEAYISYTQEELKEQLEDYRWSLNRGSVDGLPEVSYVKGVAILHNDDARIRLDTSISNIFEKGFDLSSPYDDFKDAFGNYPEELTYGDVAGNPDTTPVTKSWRLMLGETEAVLFNREKALREEIDAMTTKEQVDQFNVVAELDALVKIVLMSDLTTYAYPIKYYNQDNP